MPRNEVHAISTADTRPRSSAIAGLTSCADNTNGICLLARSLHSMSTSYSLTSITRKDQNLYEVTLQADIGVVLFEVPIEDVRGITVILIPEAMHLLVSHQSQRLRPITDAIHAFLNA